VRDRGTWIRPLGEAAHWPTNCSARPGMKTTAAIVVALSACAGDAPVSMPHVSSALSQACGGGATLEGVDVSDAQGAIDWTSAAASGLSFAWIKATQGTYFTSSRFATTWPGARAA